MITRTTAVDNSAPVDGGKKQRSLRHDELPQGFVLWSFGDNSRGALMVDTPSACVPEPQRIGRLDAQRVAFLACGPQTTFVVGTTGDIWAAGDNSERLLSVCFEDDGDVPDSLRKPLKLGQLSNVKCLAVSETHGVIVPQNGVPLTFGVNEFGELGRGDEGITPQVPRSIPSFQDYGGVSCVCSGDHFSLFLTRWGEVFSCGNNLNGCLGLADIDGSPVPLRIAKLAGNPVAQIAAGRSHCLALTMSGTLYAWGVASSGQLGLGKDSPKKIFVPKKVPLPAKPRRIAAGAQHSLVVLSGGFVAAAGLNTSGQCGWSPEIPNVHDFQLVSGLPAERKWPSVAAGEAHSVLTSNQGEVYAFGRNLEGQLGIGRISSFEHIPVRSIINDMAPEGSVLFCYIVGAGSHHTAVASTVMPLPTRLSAGAPAGVAHISLVRQESQLRPRRTKRFYPRLFYRAKTEAQLPLFAIPSVEVSDINLAPDGTRVGYMAADFNELLCQTKQTGIMQPLKDALGGVFSSPIRISCSFLLESKAPELDVTGMAEFYRRLDADLGDDIRDELYAHLVQCIERAVAEAEDYAAYFTEEAQIRFLLVCIAAPPFRIMPASQTCGAVLGRLFALVTATPVEGRKHLHRVMAKAFPPEPFQELLVNPARFNLGYILPRNVGKQLPEVDSLWDTILFLQICYLANESVASETRIEESTRRLGKVPRENLAVVFPSIGMIDPVSEYRVFVSFVERDRKKQAQRDREAAAAKSAGALTGEKSETSQQRQPVESVGPAASEIPPPGIPTTTDSPLRQRSDTQSEYDLEESWRFNPGDVLSEEGAIDSGHRFFLAHSNLLPMTFKRDVFRGEARIRQSYVQREAIKFAVMQGLQVVTPFCVLHIRRDKVVEDATTQLSMFKTFQLLKPLRIQFQGEEGVDEGGLTREFFKLIFSKLLGPEYGMFTYDAETRTQWFSVCALEDQPFALIGLLIGMAIYNNIPLELRLAPVVYKKLLGGDGDLADFATVNASRSEALRRLVEWKVETPDEKELFDETCEGMRFVEEIDYFGAKQEHELKPGGAGIQITLSNRQEYADLVADFYVNGVIDKCFREFRRGFLALMNSSLLRVLTPPDLHQLVCGSESLDFEELQQGARYEGGFTPDSHYIQEFWRVVRNWDNLKKQKFLVFCTGSDRSPVGGLKELRLLIQKNGAEPTNHLPTAYTCFNALLLPEYESVDKMEKLLITGIENSEGFGLR